MIHVSLQSWYWFKYKIHSAAIMGKSTAAPKKAAKEKVKSKAKAKAKAASQALVVQPVEDANDVSRAEISKFITALKYKAKNPKDPQSQGSQMVLEDRGLDQHEPIYKYIYIFIKFVIN